MAGSLIKNIYLYVKLKYRSYKSTSRASDTFYLVLCTGYSIVEMDPSNKAGVT